MTDYLEPLGDLVLVPLVLGAWKAPWGAIEDQLPRVADSAPPPGQ